MHSGRVASGGRARRGMKAVARHTLSVYDVPAKPELKNLHYRNHQPYVITYNHINNLKFNKNLINSPVTTAAQIQLLRDVSTTESVD